MISSYFENSYGDVIKSIVVSQKPTLIIEFGILFGYSTLNIVEGMKINGFGNLIAHDLFDEFKYNHADENICRKMFDGMKNVFINKKSVYDFDRDEIKNCELLLIDVGNTVETYDFFIKEIYPLLGDGTIAILEGGSKQRDEIYKQKKYSDKSIFDYLKNLRETNKEVNFVTLNKYPSITIFTK